MCQDRIFGFSGLLGDIQVLKHNKFQIMPANRKKHVDMQCE